MTNKDEKERWDKNDSDSGRDSNTSRASLHFNSIESSLCGKKFGVGILFCMHKRKVV